MGRGGAMCVSPCVHYACRHTAAGGAAAHQRLLAHGPAPRRLDETWVWEPCHRTSADNEGPPIPAADLSAQLEEQMPKPPLAAVPLHLKLQWGGSTFLRSLMATQEILCEPVDYRWQQRVAAVGELSTPPPTAGEAYCAGS